MKSYLSLLAAIATAALVDAGTDKTLAPTDPATRPGTPAPITPFPTEPPGVLTPVPSPSPVRLLLDCLSLLLLVDCGLSPRLVDCCMRFYCNGRCLVGARVCVYVD